MDYLFKIKFSLFRRLMELEAEKKNNSESKSVELPSGFDTIKLILKNIGVEPEDFSNLQPLEMATANTSIESPGSPVIFIPGIEGIASSLKPLAMHLRTRAVCLQYPLDLVDQSPKSLAGHLLPVRWINSSRQRPLMGNNFL